MKKENFPKLVDQYPSAHIPFKGVSSRLIQAENQQIIFMQFDEDLTLPEHTHEAQWGIVLEGEMELTVEGVSTTYTKGDYYHLPANVIHSAKVKKGYKDLTIFNQKDRYRKAQ